MFDCSMFDVRSRPCLSLFLIAAKLWKSWLQGITNDSGLSGPGEHRREFRRTLWDNEPVAGSLSRA